MVLPSVASWQSVPVAAPPKVPGAASYKDTGWHVLGAGRFTPCMTRVPPPVFVYAKHKSALALGEVTMTRLRAVKISNPLRNIVILHCYPNTPRFVSALK